MSIRALTFFALAGLMSGLLIGGSPAGAANLTGFQQAPNGVPTSMVASHEQRFTRQEGYFEVWSYVLLLQNGEWIHARFLLSNLGPKDHHGAVDVMRWKKQDDGKSPFSRRIDKVDVSLRKTSPSPFAITFNKSTLTRTASGYKLVTEIDDYRLEADLKSVGPTWRPGNGTVKFPDGGTWNVHAMPTLARVKGRERVGGGEWTDIKGYGWGEHSFTDIMPQKLSDQFLRFYGRKGNKSIMFTELFTPGWVANERVGFLVVTEGSKVLFSSVSAHSTPERVLTDRLPPYHKVPQNYVVEAPVEGGKLVLKVVNKQLIHREDVMGSLPKWVQSVLRVFVEPFNYFLRAKFQLTAPDGEQFVGSGHTIFSRVKKPR